MYHGHCLHYHLKLFAIYLLTAAVGVVIQVAVCLPGNEVASFAEKRSENVKTDAGSNRFIRKYLLPVAFGLVALIIIVLIIYATIQCYTPGNSTAVPTEADTTKTQLNALKNPKLEAQLPKVPKSRSASGLRIKSLERTISFLQLQPRSQLMKSKIWKDFHGGEYEDLETPYSEPMIIKKAYTSTTSSCSTPKAKQPAVGGGRRKYPSKHDQEEKDLFPETRTLQSNFTSITQLETKLKKPLRSSKSLEDYYDEELAIEFS